jgi:hypothetical protein
VEVSLPAVSGVGVCPTDFRYHDTFGVRLVDRLLEEIR